MGERIFAAERLALAGSAIYGLAEADAAATSDTNSG
jgi:hypothetical protein